MKVLAGKRSQRPLRHSIRSLSLWTLCVGLILVSCGETGSPGPVSDGLPLDLDRTQLFNYLTTGNPEQTQPTGTLPATPFYSGWSLFPGPQDNPDEFLNKRLGIATHGRWVTVYVNPIAKEAIEKQLQAAASDGGKIPALDMPDGSIILKVNYPNVNEAGIIAQAKDPAVLTALYKPGNGFCESKVKFNGTDCLGGGWMWAFYGIDAPHLPRDKFDKFVGANAAAFCINCHDPGFHNDYIRSLERLVRTEAHAQQPTRAAAVPPSIVDDDPLCHSPELSSTLPLDVSVNPLSLPAEQRQRLFDCFSWRAFVALNWPANLEQRGQPDTTAAFGDFSDGRETVWETYKATYELFQPQDPDWDPTDPGNPASEFNSPRPLPQSCEAIGSSDDGGTPLPLIHMVSKSNSALPDTPPDVANETGQAFAGQFGTLTDRNGQLVRYQVLFNETEFDFLKPSAVTRDLTPNGPDGGQDVFFPDGSLEVKSAWKILCSAEDKAQNKCTVEDDVDTFYRRPVYLYDAPKDTCQQAEVGLVGMHVITKTFWAPQWVWATFEHVKNVPPVGTAGDGYSFFDASCKPQPGHFPVVACSAQPFLAPKGKADPCCPNALLNRWPEIGFGTTPNQLTRLDPIAGSGLNATFKGLMGAGNPAFANYALVRTQWPLHGRRPMPEGEPLPVNMQLCESQQDDSSHPLTSDAASKKDPNCYTAIPRFSRNTVIESYMTTYVEDPHDQVLQVSNRSCMGCHKAGTDFSYLWVDAVEQIVLISSLE